MCTTDAPTCSAPPGPDLFARLSAGQKAGHQLVAATALSSWLVGSGLPLPEHHQTNHGTERYCYVVPPARFSYGNMLPTHCYESASMLALIHCLIALFHHGTPHLTLRLPMQSLPVSGTMSGRDEADACRTGHPGQKNGRRLRGESVQKFQNTNRQSKRKTVVSGAAAHSRRGQQERSAHNRQLRILSIVQGEK